MKNAKREGWAFLFDENVGDRRSATSFATATDSSIPTAALS